MNVSPHRDGAPSNPHAAKPHRRPRHAHTGPILDPESRLLESEAQRLGHVGSWEWDAVRDIVVWSPEIFHIYGLRRDEFPGTYEGFLKHVHPNDIGYTREVIAKAFREGKPFSYDHRIIRGDGAVRMLQTRGGVVKGRGGAVTRLVGCCMDVTEQWEIRRKLQESMSLLRATLDSTDDGIFVIDLDGKIVTCNRRALELWKVPESLAARGDIRAMLKHIRDQVENPDGFVECERLLLLDPAAKGVDTIRFKDGRIFERFTQPHRLGDRIVGRVCSFRDVSVREHAITELHKLGADFDERVRQRTSDLRTKTEELARSNEELEVFAAVASHDLNAPVRKIAAMVQILEQSASAKLDANEKALLARIRKSASNMNRLIGDVLALARVSREPLAVEEVDLNATLAEVLSDLDPAIERVGGKVDAGPLPLVRGHRSLWRRLLQNLVGNALKFRSPGRAPRLKIRSQDSLNGGAVLSIEDNGIGFDPKFSKEIFLPFRRLHSDALYEGSGIGLAICDRIVQRYGGEISAQSEPGSSSTFIIRLPASALEPR